MLFENENEILQMKMGNVHGCRTTPWSVDSDISNRSLQVIFDRTTRTTINYDCSAAEQDMS